MSSFFNQTNATPQPVFPGFSTTQQALPATGATASAAPQRTPGSNAPQTGKAQGAGQAPQYTNLQQFLSGQSQDQVNSEVNPLVNKANKLAQNTQDATNSATKSTAAATAAGTDNGVFGNAAASGSTPAGTAPPAAPATGLAAIADAASGRVGGHNLDSSTPPTAVSQSGVVASTAATDPTYDFSKVNLNGYTGPSVNDVGGAFGQAQSASAAAQANASGLASGTPTYNAFDNAVLTKNPGAWGKLQAALTGENQAVANAGAQQAGAQQGVAQAQQASGNAVAAQKQGLQTASDAAAATAAGRASTLNDLSTALASGDPQKVSGALATPQLASVGLDPQYASQLREGLANGTLSLAQVQTAVQPYIDAAKTSSGYTASAASTYSQANGFLKSGKTATAPAPVIAPKADLAGMKDTTAEVSSAKDALHQVDTMPVKPTLNWLGQAENSNGDAIKSQNDRAGAYIKDLLSKGYTPEQLGQMLGIPSTQVNSLANETKATLTKNSVANAAAKAANQAGKK